jgi:hypothetical protein
MIETSSVSQHRASPTSLGGGRRRVDVVYGYLAALFLLGVLAQVYLAGVGAFGHKEKGDGAFNPHESLGNVLGIVAVVLLVLALIARESKRTVIASFVLALLTEVAQHGLAQGGHSDKWVGGLHAFDGMLILGLAAWLVISWRRRYAASL